MKNIRSPINYTGNKYRILKEIKNQIPSNINIFVDLFCGGATVGFNVKANKIYLIDSNLKVINLLRTLAENDFERIIVEIEKNIKNYSLSYSYKEGHKKYKELGYIEGNNGLKKYNLKGYSQLKEKYNSLKNKNTFRANIMLYLLMVYGFNNDIRFNMKGEFNLPVGKTDFNKNNYIKLFEFNNRAKEINYEFICMDFRDEKIYDILEKADFIYSDPPYLITTAVYNENNGWNKKKESELLKLLKRINERKIKFLLSNVIEKTGLKNELLLTWIKNNNFIIKNINYNYNSSSYNKKNRDSSEKEVLVMNEDINLKKIEIYNRRYIGGKRNLIPEIEKIISKYFKTGEYIFFEPFAGTGVVSNYFKSKAKKVIVNDLLYSNYITYNTWISNNDINIEIINKYINLFNDLEQTNIQNNYFSEVFGDKYFHREDAKLIGNIREKIEKIKKELTQREYHTLLSSLMYETDRIANTCGHFESFLKKSPEKKGIKLKLPKIEKNNIEVELYCEDANKLVRKIYSDVVYIDPPYNARQYINFYHVLENLILWQKPKDLEGNSAKFKRNHLKSDYSKAKAPQVFRDLIENINSKLIIVSYNNTYNANSSASNNKITESEIINILSERGKVEKIEIDHKYFNAGKTNFNNHKEFLFICEVR